ncbi:MAG: hypothetical protein DRG50_07610, partial [Deltaproteobacteria bacterium]
MAEALASSSEAASAGCTQQECYQADGEIKGYQKGDNRMKIRHNKWFWVAAAILVLAAVTFPALAAEKQPSEGRVAVVNGSVITQADFD